ncbi:DUF4259 domain-containing protein [Hymenobacter glacieicola]|uniref:DUF4259 domain-containing protein n=1 Tax=Hymenobacter glacieicola TaxID=1562124 RepID=A0ABQ1WXW7_9BACT|nr:DUF4259 domain-containing protein [Hymenobacter glacieicola]GGG50267.1 hypothetical protein GCM10011378_28010 [Hymenobacter glacieicola]
MATWDYHNFDNDAAADLAEEFRRNPNEALLYEVLATAAEAEEVLDEEEGSQALAAAEIVAAIHGHPGADFLPGLTLAVNGMDADEELAELAQQAVETVLKSSALQARWASSADAANWQQLQQDLLARLTAE